MDLKTVKQIKVKRKSKRRVGRGQGSGWGTTSGRGHKGAGQRSGNVTRLHFEGGQMPLHRRLPKKGFSNAKFKLRYHVVNVGDLENRCEAGAQVDLEALKAVGLAPKKAKHLKILGWGEVTKSLHVTAHAVSDGAKKKLEAASGTVQLIPARTEYRPRGVKKPQADRPSGDGNQPQADRPSGDGSKPKNS